MLTLLFFPDLLKQFSDQKWFVINIFPTWALEDYLFNLGWIGWSLETPEQGLFLLYQVFITVVVHWSILKFATIGFSSSDKSNFKKIFYAIVLLIIGTAFYEYFMWFVLVSAITLSWILSSIGFFLGLVVFLFIALPIIGVCFAIPPIGLFVLYENFKSNPS